MALLLDTHVLLWIGTDDPRLSRKARQAIADADATLFVSSIVAYEFEDLRARGRFGPSASLEQITDPLGATILDYPSDAHRLVALMPMLHRDPVDRMLIAHALYADLTLVTADNEIHRYPVRTLW